MEDKLRNEDSIDSTVYNYIYDKQKYTPSQ